MEPSKDSAQAQLDILREKRNICDWAVEHGILPAGTTSQPPSVMTLISDAMKGWITAEDCKAKIAWHKKLTDS